MNDLSYIYIFLYKLTLIEYYLLKTIINFNKFSTKLTSIISCSILGKRGWPPVALLWITIMGMGFAIPRFFMIAISFVKYDIEIIGRDLFNLYGSIKIGKIRGLSVDNAYCKIRTYMALIKDDKKHLL